MADIGLSAFSVFFMQSPSFLAHQRVLAEHCGRSNAEALFGMTTIPRDNHIRQMLDGVPADHFDPLFAKIVKELDDSGGLQPLRRLDGRVLIALNGSEHFRSRKVHCRHCSTRRRAAGSPGSAGGMPGCGRSTWGTTSMPASRCAPMSWRRAAASSSDASHRATRR